MPGQSDQCSLGSHTAGVREPKRHESRTRTYWGNFLQETRKSLKEAIPGSPLEARVSSDLVQGGQVCKSAPSILGYAKVIPVQRGLGFNNDAPKREVTSCSPKGNGYLNCGRH